MDTVTIRNQIQRARQHETLTHELATLLQARLNRLHSTICVKSAQPHMLLLSFVTTFVERTPDLLDTLQDVARHTPQEELSDRIGNICLGFFTAPPPLLKGHNGMNGIMAKAYLCRRIVEEINDCYRVCCHRPLLPVDFTGSNLIIHQLIGEPLGNLLDNLVHIAASQLYEIYDFRHFAALGSVDTDELLATCRRRDLLGDNLRQSVMISNLFPGCTIH